MLARVLHLGRVVKEAAISSAVVCGRQTIVEVATCSKNFLPLVEQLLILLFRDASLVNTRIYICARLHPLATLFVPRPDPPPGPVPSKLPLGV